MARIDYYDIELELKDILEAAPELTTTGRDVVVIVEEELAFERGDIILIDLDRREAPEDQPLAAGLRTRYLLSISIWCYGFGLMRADAMRNRDDLVGRVEIVLQNNRTLNDKVSTSWFTGGEFENRRNEPGDQFLSGAEIELVVDVKAVST